MSTFATTFSADAATIHIPDRDTQVKHGGRSFTNDLNHPDLIVRAAAHQYHNAGTTSGTITITAS